MSSTSDENEGMTIYPMQKLYGHVSDVTCCDFCGRSLVTCSTDKTIRIWNVQDGLQYVESLYSPLIGHKYGILSCCFSPFGSLLATSSIDGNTILWKVEYGQQEAALRHPSGLSVRACRFSPNSLYLATGGEDYVIIIWDVATKMMLRTLMSHEDIVTCVSFTPDSNYLVSGSSDCTLEFWSMLVVNNKSAYCLKEVHDLGVVGCDFSYKMKPSVEDDHSMEYLLATCGNDDFVRLWKVQAGPKHEVVLLYQLEGHSANVMCCRFSPDGCLLVSVSGDKSVILWDPKSGKKIEKRCEHTRYVTTCSFSSNGQILVTGSNDRTVIVWKLCQNNYSAVTTNDVQNTDLSVNQITVSLPSNDTNRATSSNTTSRSQITKWTVDDVSDWFKSQELDEYVDIFRKNAIDGQELLYLNHHSLENKLNVSAYGHRNKILRGINILKNPATKAYMQVEIDDSSIPEEFFCPITQQRMKDPVLAADGHSYERSAISEWFNNGKNTSPMTNEILTHKGLTPNHLLKSLIRRLPAQSSSM